MGLFRKRRPEPVPVEDDASLPLDVNQAARLRALVREVFAEAGSEVVVHADHVEDDQGARFGLWNLAAVCADQPEHEWPAIVGQHVEGLLDSEDLDQVPEADLLVSTYLRMIEAAQMPRDDWHPTATRVGDDVLVVLAIDRPGTVATPPESFWAERGGVERWRTVGRTNLAALLGASGLAHDRVAPPDGVGGFDVVMGDSFFTGSLALLLDDVVRRYGAQGSASHGVLVCVPFRHQLAWAVVHPGADAVLALSNLFGFAAAGFSDAPGPVSPHVYWVRDGRWHQLTRIEPDGLGVIDVPPEVAVELGLTED